MHWQVLRVQTGEGTQRSGSSILPTLCLPADQPVGFWNRVTGPTRQRLAARESWVSGRRGEATAGDPWLSDPPTLRVAPPVWRSGCRGRGTCTQPGEGGKGTRTKFNTQNRHCDRPLPALGCTHSPACAQHASRGSGPVSPACTASVSRGSLCSRLLGRGWRGGGEPRPLGPRRCSSPG